MLKDLLVLEGTSLPNHFFKIKKQKQFLCDKPIPFLLIFRVMIDIGEQVYSILLLTFFFMEVNYFAFVNLL